MKNYSVKQLANITGVSVRTLHYYDEIGLLKPHGRSDSDYRIYGEDELLRLQQILFYKELNIELSEIGKILDDPKFNLLEALNSHKKEVKFKLERYNNLLKTIEKTINKINQKNMMKDEEMYEGFSPETKNPYRDEAIEKWGEDAVLESEKRLKNLSKNEWEELKNRGEEINKRLASLMSEDPGSESVQAVIDEHLKYLNHFTPTSVERYLNLGKMYVEDERFKATYDKYGVGLAEFLYEAIKIYCKKES